jgi:hypothetical protein
MVEQHRRLYATCPACRTRVAALRTAGADATPLGRVPTSGAAAVVGPVRAAVEPGRADEPAALHPGLLCRRPGRGARPAAAGSGGGLRRDRGAHRRRQQLPLGVPLPGRGSASRRPDPGGSRGRRVDGQASARRVALGSLLGPTRSWRVPADLPGASGT